MKQKTIDRLTSIMAEIHETYYRDVKRADGIWGDVGSLWVHEGSGDTPTVSIDLYHFEGDGLPVCDGLTWPGTCPHCHEATDVRAFCVHYNPADAPDPVTLLCYEDQGDCDDWWLKPADVPESVLQAVADWLEAERKH